eukprot:3936382-Rhodomonas_salina.1
MGGIPYHTHPWWYKSAGISYANAPESINVSVQLAPEMRYNVFDFVASLTHLKRHRFEAVGVHREGFDHVDRLYKADGAIPAVSTAQAS